MEDKKSRLPINWLTVLAVLLFGCTFTSTPSEIHPLNTAKPSLSPTTATSSLPTATPSTRPLTPTPTATVVPTEFLWPTNVTTPTISTENIVFCTDIPEPIITSRDDDPIHVTGEAILCTISHESVFREAALDLDTGMLSERSLGLSDIALELGNVTLDGTIQTRIDEINNAQVDTSDKEILSQSYCNKLLSAKNRLTFIITSPGYLGCVLTNQRRLAYVQVNREVDTGKAIIISFTFITLKK